MLNHATLLIVEDNPRDYETTMRAFKELGFNIPVIRCNNGDEAIDYLFRQGNYTDPRNSPRPALVLLDLNLPGTDGRDVLRRTKSDESLRMIPIIVLTTSNAPGDIEACYELGANSFVSKPVDFEDFTEAAKKTVDFWFKTARLPEEELGRKK